MIICLLPMISRTVKNIKTENICVDEVQNMVVKLNITKKIFNKIPRGRNYFLHGVHHVAILLPQEQVAIIAGMPSHLVHVL